MILGRCFRQPYSRRMLMSLRKPSSQVVFILVLLLAASAVTAEMPVFAPGSLAAATEPTSAGLGTSMHAAEIGGRCFLSSQTLCLHDERFSVEVEWKDRTGHRGQGQLIPFWSSDSGIFWFFSPNNWEMLVKVIDGCSINDRFWVFAASTTNIELTLTVTDHGSGLVKQYFKPLGNPAPAITDTDAFPSCRPPGPVGLLLFANPSNLSVLGSSQITVIARDAFGFPFSPGVRIRLLSDLGTLEPEVVFTDSQGEAQAVFQAGEQPGIATVTALAGGSEPASTGLIVRDAPTDISLQPNPASVPRGASSQIELTAQVTGSQGLPFQGQVVTFQSELGFFENGNVAFTNTSGTARVTLRLSPSELPGNITSFEVLARTGGAQGDLEATSLVLVR
jgi:hypothetical protein